MARLRQAIGTGSGGTTLLGLRRGAEQVGFHARAVRADGRLLDQIEAIPLPAICHWRGQHWVVLHGRRRQRWLVADPAVGLRELSRDEFGEGWSNGVLLLLEPDPVRLAAEANGEDQPVQPLLALLQRLRPQRDLLLQVLLINAVIGLLALSLPLLMQLLTDDVLVRRDSQLLTSLGLAMLLLFGLRSLVTLIQGHLVGHFAQRLLLSMVLEYGHKLLRLPLSYFDSHRSGEVVSRISDIDRIHQLIGQLVLGLPSQLFIALVSLLVMLRYSPALSGVSLLAFAAVSGCGLVFLPALQQKTRRLITEAANNQGFLVEAFRGAQVLKTTEATPQAWEEVQRNFGRLAFLRWSTLQLDLLSGATTGFLSSATTLGLLWYGSSFVISGELSIGQLLAFNGFSANVLGCLTALVGFGGEWITSQVVIRRLSEVLEASVEDPTEASKPAVTLPSGCPVHCEQLSFHHPGRVELLEDFSVTVPGGVCTALIGESGCGKSTLVKLISGLYAPQRGTIRYGPYGLRDMALENLRRQVCLVPQEAQFFNRSILDNFRFAYPQLSFEQVIAACELAQADGFIRDLPDGYQTVLGEFGANLSGGQRQRLAIARALVADPAILILDESSSALDPVLEQRLIERLLLHRSQRTTVLISHRPSVIGRCDWVIYLERGRVRFQGPPDELRRRPALSAYLNHG